MKQQNAQQGSAHIVIIAILVVALIGALGWIFWQNFKQASTDNVNVSTSEGTSKNEQNVVEVRLENEGLLLTVPTSWQSDIETVAGTEFIPKHDSGTIKKVNGSATLFAETGISGLGGTCEPDMQNALTIVEATKTKAQVTPVDGFGGSEVYAVKSYYYDPENGYAPFVFISSNPEIGSKTVYDTCLPGLVALVSGGNVDGVMSIATAGGITSNGGEPFPFVSTKADALRALNSSDMNEAYTILQTANY